MIRDRSQINTWYHTEGQSTKPVIKWYHTKNDIRQNGVEESTSIEYIEIHTMTSGRGQINTVRNKMISYREGKGAVMNNRIISEFIDTFNN
jgi:hypothetical protein